MKSIIESLCHKRGLSVQLSFKQMKFTHQDLQLVNEMVWDRFRHHLEVYAIDTIEDLCRIINNQFDKPDA